MGKLEVKHATAQDEDRFIRGLVDMLLVDMGEPVRLVPISRGAIRLPLGGILHAIGHPAFSRIGMVAVLEPTGIDVHYRQDQYEAMLN